MNAGETATFLQSMPDSPGTVDFTQEPDPFPVVTYASTGAVVTGASATGGMTTRSILTLDFVTQLPSVPSFAPAWVGTNKTVYPISQMMTAYAALPNNPLDGSEMNVEDVIRGLSRVSMPGANYAQAGVECPANAPIYGRERSFLMGAALGLLTRAIDPADKLTLAKLVVQRGIDEKAAYDLDPDIWGANGGYTIGHKAPMVFASHMLGLNWNLTPADPTGNNPFPALGPENSGHGFIAEDQWCYMGEDQTPPEQLWTGWQNSGDPTASNVMTGALLHYEGVGPGSWGVMKDPYGRLLMSWDKPFSYFRQNIHAMVGYVAAADILGLRPAWNWEPLFLMMHRWMRENDAKNLAAMAAASLASVPTWDAIDPTEQSDVVVVESGERPVLPVRRFSRRSVSLRACTHR